MGKPEAIIFDLDGTLVDSMWMWRSIDIEYLARFGISLPDDLQRSIEGMSFSETAVYFKERFLLPDSLEQIKADWNRMAMEYYRTRVSLKSGAREFLADCKRQGIKTGIATSNSRELLDAVLDALQIREQFTSVHTSCEVAKGKPSPDIYLHVANALGVSPDRCLVFEDIPPGLLAGRRAGMKTCAVYDANAKAEAADIARMADVYIRDFYEAQEAMEALFPDTAAQTA